MLVEQLIGALLVNLVDHERIRVSLVRLVNVHPRPLRRVVIDVVDGSIEALPIRALVKAIVLPRHDHRRRPTIQHVLQCLWIILRSLSLL